MARLVAVDQQLLGGAIGRLAEQAPSAGVDVGAFRQAVRTFDLSVLWLRRLWEFFAEKLDQRSDDRFKAVLAAADEVVWSCYAPVFGDQTAVPRGPVPLPFVESELSPAAFPPALIVQDVNRRMSPSVISIAGPILQTLDLPVVRVPLMACRAPWWLVLLGHEVGHHVQYAAQSRFQLVSAFEAAVKEGVDRHKPEAADRWAAWSREIFADAFSLAAMGPWAIAALEEIEDGPPESLLAARPSYPAPLVRRALLDHMARQLQLPVEAGGPFAGRLPDSSLPPAVADDMEMVPHVARVALNELPGYGLGVGELLGLSACEFSTGGAVAQMAQALLEGRPPILQTMLRVPRLLCCSGMAAWDERNQDDATAAFAERVMAVISESGPGGVRSADHQETSELKAMERAGQDLVELLDREARALQAKGMV